MQKKNPAGPNVCIHIHMLFHILREHVFHVFVRAPRNARNNFACMLFAHNIFAHVPPTPYACVCVCANDSNNAQCK